MLSECIGLVSLLSSYNRLRQDGFNWTPLFLDKESQKEVGSLTRLESGGHDAVRPGSQQEPFGYLSQVGEHSFSNLHRKHYVQREYRLYVILLKKRFIFEPRERNSWDNIIPTDIAGNSLDCWIGKKQHLVEEATSLCPICVCIQRSGTRSEVFCCRLDPLFEPGTQSLSRWGESGRSNNSQLAL